MGLIQKKLSRQPIGVHVELLCDYGDHQETLIGIITDSDFDSELEITDTAGVVKSFSYEIVKSMTVTRQLPEILSALTPGTKIRFSHGPEDNREPNMTGTVLENDEGSLEIETTPGKSICLDYDVVRSLLILSNDVSNTSAPPSKPEKPPVPFTKVLVKAPKRYESEPVDTLMVGDNHLKKALESLTPDDRKLFQPYCESFFYGIRIKNKQKIDDAAIKLRKLVIDRYNDHYDWSTEAIRLCGYFLRRVQRPDYKIPVMKRCFRDAAVYAYKQQQYDLTAVFAILSLLNNESTDSAVREDMLILVEIGMEKCNDISGLRLLCDAEYDHFELPLDTLIADAYARKGLPYYRNPDRAAALSEIEDQYSGDGVAQQLGIWAKEIPAQMAKESGQGEEKQVNGYISRLLWVSETGTIAAEGENYQFSYADVTDPQLREKLAACKVGAPDSDLFPVSFCAVQNTAKNIAFRQLPATKPPVNYMKQVKAILYDTSDEERFAKAFPLLVKAMETDDAPRAVVELLQYALRLDKTEPEPSHIPTAIELFEKHEPRLNASATTYSYVVTCCGQLKDFKKMMFWADKAVAVPNTPAGTAVSVMQACLHEYNTYWEYSDDVQIQTWIIENIDVLQKNIEWDMAKSSKLRSLFNHTILPAKVRAFCELKRLDEARATLRQIPRDNVQYNDLNKRIHELVKSESQDDHEKETETPPTAGPVSGENGAISPSEDLSGKIIVEITEPDPLEEDEDIPQYSDTEGWYVLGLTKKDVVDYALRIRGESRISLMMTYLHAGASLNQELEPLCHAAALAVNDPMEKPEYSSASLMEAIASSDSDYPELYDCCIGAAYLRAVFRYNMGYDYSAKNLRDSIAVNHRIPVLKAACETMTDFQFRVGCAIDNYAEYRHSVPGTAVSEIDSICREADMLYTKYILTPPAPDPSFRRGTLTKIALYDPNGYLGTMLKAVKDRDASVLTAKRDHFEKTFLNGTSDEKLIARGAVDDLIDEAIQQVCRNYKYDSFEIEGRRMTSLENNITEILRIVQRWYLAAAAEKDVFRDTPDGTADYQRTLPLLMEQLQNVCRECEEEIQVCENAQLETGLFLLSSAAKELLARLNGSWKPELERFFYKDFLHGCDIMLDRDFLPDLSASFCALSEFNIMSRIRHHIESPKLSFSEQIERICSADKYARNFGTASLIAEYLQVSRQEEETKLPDNFEKLIQMTEDMVEMNFRNFRETCALAMSYGQIIKSDAFCNTLEDTARYWYYVCRDTRNYGFFLTLLQHAENQIHESARQYEGILTNQLEGLVAGNKASFDEHPEYEKEIRRQIANQNFTVAEDWMSRIRIGDFNLEVQKPEALHYLEQFLNEYSSIFSTVADCKYTLSSIIGPINVHNKDTRGGSLLIENWLSNGNASNAARIKQELTLLGWRNISAERYVLEADPRAEWYEIRRQDSQTVLTPQHPISVFGSALDKNPMYVVCLYGVYECDRLFEKIRTLDVIDGSKIILLDCAIGQADRRRLARKLKKRENVLKNTYLVIDRVLITFLSRHYNENLISRILMSTAMPFSYCQPYVVESAHPMPPEIFIGRRDELVNLERADGVNLIYGGRQLGKTALFKKAVSDLDGYQGQRAVLIDIKDLGCAKAAEKISRKLIDLKITPEANPTDDWDTLSANIEHSLREDNCPIRYFLLMLDEADAFINDCAGCGFHPMVALKDLQQTMNGQFKYVLAGLHNIVKFNRQVALGNNSVVTHMSSLKITPFLTPDAQELLTMPLSYLGFSLPSKVTISQILATCNYFPVLIQLYAQKLIESIRGADYAGYDIGKTPPYVVSDEHLRRVMSDREFVDQIHEKFEITLKLDQDQGSCYYPLTLLIGWLYHDRPSPVGYTAYDILSCAKNLHVQEIEKLDEQKINTLLMELQDLNILRSVSDNSYLLASKNFRDLLGSDEDIMNKLIELQGGAE